MSYSSVLVDISESRCRSVCKRNESTKLFLVGKLVSPIYQKAGQEDKTGFYAFKPSESHRLSNGSHRLLPGPLVRGVLLRGIRACFGLQLEKS